MSRFSNYLQSQKLAKLLVPQAEIYAQRGENDKAIRDLAKAVREMLTACNNLASIQFEPRRRV